MAKLTMKRIEILALLEDSQKLLDLLQRRGYIEVTDSEETDSLYKLATQSSLSIFEKGRSAALAALATLETYAPRKHSLLGALAGRRELTVSEFLTRVDDVDDTMRRCYDINDLAKKIADLKTAAVHIGAQLDAVTPWLGLDVSMRTKGTAQTTLLLGTLPAAYTAESLTQTVAQGLEQEAAFVTEVVYTSKDRSCAAVLVLNEDADRVESALRENGFVRVAENAKGLPADRADEYNKELERLNAEGDKAAEDIAALATLYDDIEFAVDYFTIRIDKYENLAKLAMSGNILVLNGYIPEDKVEVLTKELESKFAAAVSVTDTAEDDEPPILLKNNTFSAPVESVTEMYALPNNQDVDPNPVMAIFYYTFFGLMLSDAGYGLLMVFAALFAKKKFNLELKTKKTVNFVLFCGVSTLFWGAMFGGWFGDIVQVVGREFFNKDIGSLALWFEPVRDPMKLLMFSFLFGIIHLFVGLGVRFAMLWKAGKPLEAVLDVIPVYLLVLGVAPMGAGIILTVPPQFAAVGKYLALAGAVSIVLTSGRSAKNIVGKLGGGLYGLYNAGSGYLGDILSYSRLLALGLSTGVIASVVNVLGTIAGNPVIKAVMLVFVFIVGHSVNIAVNLIGTYVHTNRLHYVEFFSKFYEGGGKAFTPLKVNTKYYRFKEETVSW